MLYTLTREPHERSGERHRGHAEEHVGSAAELADTVFSVAATLRILLEWLQGHACQSGSGFPEDCVRPISVHLCSYF
jgi:hypothetical protein